MAVDGKIPELLGGGAVKRLDERASSADRFSKDDDEATPVSYVM